MTTHNNTTHYVLINESAVFTKEAAFFKSQGGLTEEWGQTWIPVKAISLYDARAQAINLRRAHWPKCHKTMGEFKGDKPEDYWPEAKGQ